MRRIVILTEGYSNPHAGKTAACVIRYRREEVLAVLDSTQRGKTAGALLGAGGDLPIVGSLAEVPTADTLLIGIAPPGGRVPAAWRSIILEAIGRGMNVVSGLHDFLSDDAEFAAAAREHGARLHDVRKNRERDVANRQGIRPDCLRIHTVGHDCSVGKMVVSVEVAAALKAAGHDAKFVATGQTGIMIEGDGLPIDCVVADFVNGAAEKLVLQNQHHDILLIEGQGSLVHPRYSAVTLGLLHGCMPHGLILCYEVGRERIGGMEQFAIPPLAELVRINEAMANLMHPCRVIGIGMNSRRVGADEAEAERRRVRAELGLPVCDVLRHGPDDLVQAVLRRKAECL
jgi:uncharacterized NAD-dependent epimerase/dehydratase family protein